MRNASTYEIVAVVYKANVDREVMSMLTGGASCIFSAMDVEGLNTTMVKLQNRILDAANNRYDLTAELIV